MKFDDFWTFWPEKEKYYHDRYLGVHISKTEYDRFYKDFALPIIDIHGSQYWFNKEGKLHNVMGYATIHKNLCDFFIDGKNYTSNEWLEVRKPLFWKRIYFLREKIITLQKLVEIPEMWDEVYYSHKAEFIELLRKL